MESMRTAVIGRRKIDSYIMYYSAKSGSALIDITKVGKNWKQLRL